MALKPKLNPIHEDYQINKEVLGLGISGKVLSCVNRQTVKKYALKVSWKLLIPDRINNQRLEAANLVHVSD